MKILLEWPRSSTYDRESFVGGVEKWVSNIYDLLLESEHDVTLLVPNDTITTDPNIILGPLKSRPYDNKKEGNTHKFDFKTFYQFIEERYDDYDVILLSSMMTSGVLRKNFEGILDKILYMQHYYELTKAAIPTFTAIFNQLAIIQAGGKVLAPNDWVSNETMKAYRTREWEPRIRTQRIRDWEREKWGDTLESQGFYNGRFDIVHYLEDAHDLKPVKKNKIVFVGRPVVDKGFIQAINVMLKLDKNGWDCHVYTREENLTKQQTIKAMEMVKESSINLHVNTLHSDIMESLSDTHIMLWPTLKETCGLVGYEGVHHGCKVIYKIDPPDCYLKDHGFKRDWKGTASLEKVIYEVADAHFDREGTSKYFREKYTRQKDMERLNEVLNSV